jgi:SAM-dependent methyltransferase
VSSSYDSRRYAQINRWNPRNLEAVLQYVRPQPGGRILDIGCGRGHLVAAMQARGFDAHGIDVNPQAAEVGIADQIHTMSADRLEFPDASFDAVVSFHAVEHIPPLDAALSEIRRVVKPEGLVMLVYPAEPFRGAFAIPTSVVLHGTPFKARQVHVHKLNPTRLVPRAEQAGFVHLESHFRLYPSPEHLSLFTVPGGPEEEQVPSSQHKD